MLAVAVDVDVKNEQFAPRHDSIVPFLGHRRDLAPVFGFGPPALKCVFRFADLDGPIASNIILSKTISECSAGVRSVLPDGIINDEV